MTRTTQLVKLASHFESFSNYPSVMSLKLSRHIKTVWPQRKGKWKYEPMEKEKENADLWKRKKKIWIHGKGKWKYGPMEKGRRRATRCLLMRWRWRASISILASSPREQGEEGGARVLPARSERYYQILVFSCLENKIINQTLDEKANKYFSLSHNCLFV